MNNKDTQYKVQIVDTDTGEVLKEFSQHSLRECEKIERGVQINLNHDEYKTKIVKA